MSREVCHNIKPLLLTEYPFKDWVCKVQRITTEFIWNIQPLCRAYITYQLRQPILVQVYYNNAPRLKLQHSLNETRADTPSSTYHAYRLSLNLPSQPFCVCDDISFKHTDSTERHAICNKLVYIEHLLYAFYYFSPFSCH